MGWRLVVIWLLCASFAASDKLPNLSDVLGSYLPPSNSHGEATPKDSFQDLNFNIPSIPGGAPDPGAPDPGIDDSDEHDSGGRHDFSNFNFNIPKNAYVEPKEEPHQASSDESSTIDIDSSLEPIVIDPDQLFDDLDSGETFIISKYSTKAGKAQHLPLCILANTDVQDKIRGGGKSVSQGRKQQGINQTYKPAKPKQIYTSPKDSEETSVTHEDRHRPVAIEKGIYEAPKQSYIAPNNVKEVPKSVYDPTREEPSDDSSEESEDKRRGHSHFGQPQVPSGSPFPSKEDSGDSAYRAPAKSHPIPDVDTRVPQEKQRYEPPRQSYVSPDQSKEVSGKTLFRPIPARPRTKPSLKDVYGSPDPSRAKEIDDSSESVSRTFGSVKSPSYQTPKPSIEKPTGIYKAPEPCCEIVKDDDDHPDSVYSLVSKSKPITIKEKDEDSDERDGPVSTSLFFKAPKDGSKPKTSYGSKIPIEDKQEESDESETPQVKDTYDTPHVAKKIPHFTNKISQPAIQPPKTSHFSQGASHIPDKTHKSPVEQTYEPPKPSYQSSTHGIKSTEPDDDSTSKSEEEPSNAFNKHFGSAIKSETPKYPQEKAKTSSFFTAPTFSISQDGDDSDEDTAPKTFKHSQGYPSVKEPHTPTLTHKASKSIYKPPAPEKSYNIPQKTGTPHTQTSSVSQSFESKETPSFFQAPSLSFQKADQTKKTYPTQGIKTHQPGKVFSTQSSDSSEDSKEKHEASRPRTGGSYHSPSSSIKDSSSQEHETPESSLFFQPPATAYGSPSSTLKTSEEDIQRYQEPVHKQSPPRKPKIEASYKTPSRETPTRKQPERFGSAYSKTTKTSDDDDDDSKSTETGKPYSTGTDPRKTHPTSFKQLPSISAEKPTFTNTYPSSNIKDKPRKLPERPKLPQSYKSPDSEPKGQFKKLTSTPSQQYESPKATGSVHFSDEQPDTYKAKQPSTKVKQVGTPVGRQPATSVKKTVKTPSGASRGSQTYTPPKSKSVDPQVGDGPSSYETTTMKMMMPYEFEWEVNDEKTRNDFGQKAISDGMVEKGEYHVLLPDGRKQVVTYLADWETGYHVDVKYEDAPGYSPPTQS